MERIRRRRPERDRRARAFVRRAVTPLVLLLGIAGGAVYVDPSLVDLERLAAEARLGELARLIATEGDAPTDPDDTGRPAVAAPGPSSGSNGPEGTSGTDAPIVAGSRSAPDAGPPDRGAGGSGTPDPAVPIDPSLPAEGPRDAGPDRESASAGSGSGEASGPPQSEADDSDAGPLRGADAIWNSVLARLESLLRAGDCEKLVPFADREADRVATGGGPRALVQALGYAQQACVSRDRYPDFAQDQDRRARRALSTLRN